MLAKVILLKKSWKTVASAANYVVDDLKKAVLALGHVGGRAIELIEDATYADKPADKVVVLLTAGIPSYDSTKAASGPKKQKGKRASSNLKKGRAKSSKR